MDTAREGRKLVGVRSAKQDRLAARRRARALQSAFEPLEGRTLLSGGADTVPPIGWQEALGGAGSETLFSLQPTSDGGYIAGGWSNSGASGNKESAGTGTADYWVAKLDSAGTKLWDRSFGGSGVDSLTSVIQTGDGGYLLGGHSTSGISGDKSSASFGNADYWVVKLNAAGEKVWDKSFGGANDDNLTVARQTGDGGYLLAGYSASSASGNKTTGSTGTIDYWVIKLNAAGEKVWEKSYGGSGSDMLYSAEQTSDGGYVLGGSSASGVSGNKTTANQGSSDYWVLKLDAAGDKVWEQTWGGASSEVLYSVQPTSDGGYVLGGYSTSGIGGNKTTAGQGAPDYWVVKLNEAGEKTWEQTYGGSGTDVLYSVGQTGDGGYILGGWSFSGRDGTKTLASAGSSDYWILKLDAAGEKVWEAAYGGSGAEELRSIHQTSYGGYVLGGNSASGATGNKSSASFGSSDYWVVLLNESPTVEFASAAATVGEDAGTATVTVNLSGGTYRDVTIPFTLSGSAVAGTDYLLEPGSLVIPKGSTSGTISVQLLNDTIYEADRSLVLTLGTPVNASAGGSGQHTLTIASEDALPSITVGDAAVVEGNAGTSTLVFTVSLSNPSEQTITVNYATADGTATVANGDYVATSGVLTFAPGVTSQTVSVVINGNTTYEADETLHLDLSGAVNAGIGDSQAVGTITNDETAPTVQFTSVSQSGSETDGAMTVTVELSAASDAVTTIPFAITGTAVAGSDYSISDNPVVIPAGATQATIVLTPVNDATYEATKTVVLTLGTPVNATVGATSQHTFTISSEDAEPTLVVSDAAVVEGNAGTSALVFTVSLSNPSEQAITVGYATADGTARLADGDYTAKSGVLTFAPGETSQTVSIEVAGEARHEVDETLQLNLSGAVNATVADGQGSGTIGNDDAAPTVQFTTASQSGGEAGGAMTVTVVLSAVSGLATTIPFSIGGTAAQGVDYSITASPITIAAGASSATILLTPVNDTTFEASKTVVLTLGTPENATVDGVGEHTATIGSEDLEPTIGVNDVTVAEGNGGARALVFTVSLSNPSDQVISVSYATADGAATAAGGDYAAASGLLTFNPGVTSQTVSLLVGGDTTFEVHETMYLDLDVALNASISRSRGVGTISNDDAAPTVQFTSVSQSGGEADGAMQVMVELSAASELPTTIPFTVSGAAILGSDYNLSDSPVVIPAGSTRAAIVVTPINDGTYEAGEAVVLTLGTPVNATVGSAAVHTATIANDDAEPTISVEDAAVAEGDTGTSALVFTVSLSNPSDQSVSVIYATASGTATASNGDYTVGSGQLTFAPGVTRQTVSIAIRGDSRYEADEVMYLDLGGAVNASVGDGRAVGTIVNDDAPPTVQFISASQSRSEAGGAMVATVAVSAVSGLDVVVPFSVGGTATAGVDYTVAAGPITIPAGSTSATITLTPVNDVIYEAGETVVLTLGAPENAIVDGVSEHTATIGNDDAPPDLAAPTAQLAAKPTVKAGAAALRFTVSYADDAALRASTIGGRDIKVTGPKRFSQLAKFISKTSAVNTDRILAVYQITPPGGKWDAGDNGVYTIWLNGGEVFDASGKSAAARKLGTFSTALRSPAAGSTPALRAAPAAGVQSLFGRKAIVSKGLLD